MALIVKDAAKILVLVRADKEPNEEELTVLGLADLVREVSVSLLRAERDGCVTCEDVLFRVL